MRQVRLLLSTNIPRDELVAFFSQVGAKYNENPHLLSPYFPNSGGAYVWIDLDDIEKRYPDPKVDALTEQKLGAIPRFSILLHINTDPESEPLALGFAIQFAERWPCVLDNLSGLARHIYSLEELRKLQEEGRGFWDDEQLVPLPKDEYEGEAFIPPGQEGF